MAPDDPFLRVMRQRGRWARGVRTLDLPQTIARGAARHMPNDPSDVAAVEMWLGQAGYYDLDRREGPTSYGGPTVDDAILRFQKDHGLTADGWAGPGGETEQALRLKAGVARSATPQAFPAPGQRNLLTDEPLLQEASWSGAARLAQHAWPHVRRWLQPDEAAPPVPPPVPMPKPPVPPAGQRPDLPPVPPSTPHGEDLPSPQKPGGIADYLLDGLGTLFRNSGGARGNDKTRKKERCRRPRMQGRHQGRIHGRCHRRTPGGAYKDGGEKYLPEETVWADPENPVRRGSVRPDLTWKITLPDGMEEWVRLNTVDTRADGQPTTRELNALDRLRRYLQDDLADWMAKGDDDPDSPEFAARARTKCREIFEKYVRKDGK
jgi:peptidoglycan hydrolase-like protein with peptidoglycan-binding domain